MPPWVHYFILATIGAVFLAAAVGAWLVWADRRQHRRAVERLHHVGESLSETAKKLGRALGEVQQFLADMRWGRRQ